MTPSNGLVRRPVFIITVSAILSIIFVFSFRNHAHDLPRHDFDDRPEVARASNTPSLLQTSLTGPPIAPRLGNETVKAELGRAAWKLLHTTMARFPDTPTFDESEALRSYVHLFQRLYPCGECAQHFGEILEKFPPQVSSRSAAAGWACHVHNEVNRSLQKGMFDCSKIGEFYDCGCADEEKAEMNKVGHERDPRGKGGNERRSVGEDGRKRSEEDRMPRERRRHVDWHSTEM